MSTLSGSINAISTAVIVDFLPIVKKDATDAEKKRIHRWLVVAIGAVGICMALVLAQFKVRSLFDTFQMLLGVLGGGFGGVFALGFFTRRANSVGAVAGLLASFAASFGLQFTKANPFLYMSAGVFTCMVVGYLVSLAFPGNPKSLEGLTMFDAKTQAQNDKD